MRRPVSPYNNQEQEVDTAEGERKFGTPERGSAPYIIVKSPFEEENNGSSMKKQQLNSQSYNNLVAPGTGQRTA